MISRNKGPTCVVYCHDVMMVKILSPSDSYPRPTAPQPGQMTDDL